MANCTVSGTFLDPSGTAISGATVRFRVDSPTLDAASRLLLPKEITTTTASNGTWSLSIVQSTSGLVMFDCPPDLTNSPVRYTFSVIVPATLTASFASIWVDQTSFTLPTTFPISFGQISGQLSDIQLPVLASTNLWVGNGSAVATAVALSGDAAMSNAGVVTVGSVGGSSAANIHSAELLANAATSSNTPSTVVKRDASGNFIAGAITSNLTGNVTGNVSGTAASFTGNLVGDVTGTQGATVVSTIATSTAANVHAAELLANAATNLNTASTIVKRDGSGNFTAGTITANLTGTASNVTTNANLTGDVTSSGNATSYALAVPAAKGGTAIDTSASTGVAKVTSGTWSVATVVNADISASAAIARTKIASGTANGVVINDGSGNLSSVAPSTNGNVLTSNGTAWVSQAPGGSASVSNLYNVIMGSAAQVSAGTATYSAFTSWTQADGDRVLILPGYVTVEALTVTKKVYIMGLGNTSQIQGAITLNTGAGNSCFENFRTTGNFTISSGVTGIFCNKLWFSSTNTFVDSNSTPASNILFGLQE